MGLIDSIIGAESGGDPNARNPNSSASGAGQFIDSTWLSTIRSARPDLADKPDADLLALKSDPQLSRQMTEAYANQNQAILSKNGLPVTPGTTYLAHFAGPGGAVKVLQADPNAPVGDVLGAAVVKANPFLAGMTVQGLQAWADKKMAGSPQTAQATLASPNTGPSANPVPSGPIGMSLSLNPAPPIFAPQPQVQPQQAQDQGFQMPAAQMAQAPPIFVAPRRSPDLSKLRAAFGRPTFSRG